MNSITLENVALDYTNFAGEERRFNDAGRRNFFIILDKETAENMMQDGWNVRHFSKRGQTTKTLYGIPVKIAPFKDGEEDKPEIKIIEKNGNERVLAVYEWAGLDSMAPAQHATVIIKPYAWEMQGRKGITAFLQTLIIDINKE